MVFVAPINGLVYHSTVFVHAFNPLADAIITFRLVKPYRNVLKTIMNSLIFKTSSRVQPWSRNSLGDSDTH